MASNPRVGAFPPLDQLAGGIEERREALGRAAEAGIDHLGVGDHVSFFVGAGRDGIVDATALLNLQPGLPVYVGLYLLLLRHPVPVARQLSTLSELAPGRLTLGVGIGGEDRHEVEVCGVDPATRGRRMDECLRDPARAARRRAGELRGRVLLAARGARRARARPAGPADRRRALGRGRAPRRAARRRLARGLGVAAALCLGGG